MSFYETHYLGNVGTASNPAWSFSRSSILNFGTPLLGQVASPHTQPNSPNYLGGQGTTNMLVGNIFELIVFGQQVTVDQQLQIQGYLTQKWGLTAMVPASHPFKSQAPLTSAGYIDGVLQSSSAGFLAAQSFQVAVPASGSSLRVGFNGLLSSNGGDIFAGSVSDLRLYNRALTPANVAAMVLPVFANAVNPTAAVGATSYSWRCLPGFFGPTATFTLGASGWAWAGGVAPSCTACPASTYSLGGTAACAGCPSTATFVSSTQGCAPVLANGQADTGVAFSLSGSQTEGLAAFATVANPGGATYGTGPFGVANTAVTLASGSYLSSIAFPSVPAYMPRTGAMSVSAWVNCAAPAAGQASVVEWGSPTAAGSNAKLGLLVKAGPTTSMASSLSALPIAFPVCDGTWHHVAVTATPVSSSLFSPTPTTGGCFNPLSIPGVQLWFDGADPTTFVTSGSYVTTWKDKSGNGFNAVGQSGTLSPTFVAGQPGLNFANGQYYNLPAGALPYGDQGYHLFIVVNFASTAIMDVICGGTASANNLLCVRSNSAAIAGASNLNAIDVYWYSGTPSQDLESLPNSFTPGATTFLESYYLGSLGVNYVAGQTSPVVRSQSVNFLAPTTTTVSVARAQPSSPNYIGNGAPTTYLTGVIYEILVYNTTVPVAAQQQIEA